MVALTFVFRRTHKEQPYVVSVRSECRDLQLNRLRIDYRCRPTQLPSHCFSMFFNSSAQLTSRYLQFCT